MPKTKSKKSILITGATSGIGFETLKNFHNIGYNVYFTYKNNKKKAYEIESNFSNTKSFHLDLSNNNNIKKFFLKFKKLNLRIDVLVNNAAETIFIEKKNVNLFNENDFLYYVQINLVSVYSVIYNSMNLLNRNASIINLSSVAAFNGIGSNLAYSASKAGVNNLTKSLARQFKGKFRVNSVAPGLLRTNLTNSFPEKYFKNYQNLTPQNKLLNPKDIAEVILSLACDMKNINGQCIVVDGGCI